MRTTMQGPFGGAFLQQLGALFQHGTTAGLTEGELLERFIRGRDESAFEVLIARHGPMVLGVCRRLLRDPNDVDDAFQATFLVLVRKAGTLRRRDLLGNWLYGVAFRVATRARVLAARRSARVPFGTEAIDQVADAAEDPAPGLDPEPIPWLHEEVRRLPEKYRVPVLLCYFEGLSHEQAAARLGWPIGTVKGRLARARDLLRKRLTRRGVELPAAVLASHSALPDFCAAVPESLRSATIRAARTVAGSTGTSIVTASTVTLHVATLAQGVLRTMILTHMKSVALTLLVAVALTTGLVIAAGQEPARKSQDDPPPPAKAKGSDSAPQKKATPKKSRASQTKSADAGGMAGMGGIGMGGGMGGMRMFTDPFEFQHRVEISQLASALAANDKGPKNQAVMAKLDKPLAMSFANPTPLDDVLKYIKAATAAKDGKVIPIYVDPKGLEQAGTSLQHTVTMDLDDVPLKMSLRLLLKQLGLAYCVRDGVLIISSVQGVREELAEAASESMATGPDSLRSLMQSIQSQGGMMGGGMR